MFKSKVFRYGAIAAAVVATSSVILASSATIQSQSETQAKKSQVQLQLLNTEKNPELPNRDKFAERQNSSDLPSGRMLKQLNLSPEQLQKLKTIRDRDPNKMSELVVQSRQANKELRDLLASTESSDVIRAKHTQVQNLHQELQKQHFERMLAMREVLTPQQRSQLNEIMQKNRPNRMKDHLQNRMDKRMENFRDRKSL